MEWECTSKGCEWSYSDSYVKKARGEGEFVCHGCGKGILNIVRIPSQSAIFEMSFKHGKHKTNSEILENPIISENLDEVTRIMMKYGWTRGRIREAYIASLKRHSA